MPEAIWDDWEKWTTFLNKFAWILTLAGGVLWIILGIINMITLRIAFGIPLIVYGSVGIVAAILFMPIAKQITAGNYESINLILLIITGAMAVGGVWYFGIPQCAIAVFICFFSQYGWTAK